MKFPWILISLFSLNLGILPASAEENAAPVAANPPPVETKKWIEATDAPWQAAYERDVNNFFASEIEKLKAQYASALEAGMAKASRANDLEGAVALRNERNRYSETKVFPDHDAPGDAELVKQIRAAARAQFAHLEEDRMTRAKALYAKYDQVLSQAQIQLTQQGRFDDAILVRTKREEVKSRWLAGLVAAPPEKTGTAPPAAAKAPSSSPITAATVAANPLTKGLPNTVWSWGTKPNDSGSITLLTIHPDETVSWSDRPSLHVHYEIVNNLSIRVRDAVWTFSADLQSFTVKRDDATSASRWGTRTKTAP